MNLAMTRRGALFVWLPMVFAPAAWSTEPAVAARPNVLIVLVDDAGYGDFGCHGHPFLRTPQIDRLYAESVRLTDFHVAPMCSPTRAALLTGAHGLRTGVTSVTAGRTFIRPEFAAAPEIFAAAGYRTGSFGKWHLGDNFPHRPIDRGFQDAVWTPGWGFTSAPDFTNTLIDGRLIRGDQPEPFTGYITDVCFNEAMRWMGERQAAGEPFFCYLPLHAAHAPLVVPPQYSEPYADKPAPNFWGMLANVDENMGRLESFLRDRGLRDNTIVVFLSDNGGTAGVRVFNAGLRGGKVNYYDGGHRVPCFIRWPNGRLQAPADQPALTQAPDLLPTLLDFCGLKPPGGPAFDGVSLAGLLRGETSALPDRLVVVQFGPGFGQQDNTGPQQFDCAVLWRNWRLVHGRELYDIDADRAQQRDVAAAHPELVADLRARYEAWWSAVAPRLREFVPTSLGAEQQPSVLLTSSDWQDTYADNAGHVRNGAGGPRGGPWNVNVERAGEYEVVLRRWPFELDAALEGNIEPPGKAFPIAAARLTAAGIGAIQRVSPGAREAVVRVQLRAGRSQLQAWFQDADGRDLCGAFYAKVSFLQP